MKHGFVIGTPLHVINSINIYKNFLEQDEVILFIQNDFNYSEKIMNSLSIVLPNVKIIKIDKKLFNNIHKSRFYNFLNINPFYKGRLDHLYIPSSMMSVRSLYGSQKKRNKDLQLHYYEDGLSPYVRFEVLIKNWKYEFFNKYSLEKANWEKAYVYEPSLIIGDIGKKLMKIPKLTSANPAFKVIKKVFDLTYNPKLTDIKNKTLIFFDQPFMSDGYNIDEVKIFSLVNELSIKYELEILIKVHPRSKIEKYGKDVKFLDTDLPWEVFLMFQNIELLIPIGINSTTLFSPLLMFENSIRGIVLTQIALDFFGQQLDNRTINSLKNTSKFTKQLESMSDNLLELPVTITQLEEIFKII